MPRYIDADALNAYIESAECNSVGKALQAIDNAPTVSPDEVRGVGKWIVSKEFKGYAMCSCCEDAFVEPEWIAKDGKWNYCPNCGARMGGVQDALS